MSNIPTIDSHRTANHFTRDRAAVGGVLPHLASGLEELPDERRLGCGDETVGDKLRAEVDATA